MCKYKFYICMKFISLRKITLYKLILNFYQCKRGEYIVSNVIQNLNEITDSREMLEVRLGGI